MNTDVFKFLGVLTFLFEAVMMLVLYGGARRMPLGPEPWTTFVRFVIFFSLVTAIGVGLLFAQRWAAAAFSMATSTWAIWMIVGTIMGVPFPVSLINLAMATLALVPSMVTISAWRDLKPIREAYP